MVGTYAIWSDIWATTLQYTLSTTLPWYSSGPMICPIEKCLPSCQANQANQANQAKQAKQRYREHAHPCGGGLVRGSLLQLYQTLGRTHALPVCMHAGLSRRDRAHGAFATHRLGPSQLKAASGFASTTWHALALSGYAFEAQNLAMASITL